MKEILKAYANYLNFGGTANRKEYIVFFLFFIITTIVFVFKCTNQLSDKFMNECWFLPLIIWFVCLVMPLISLAFRRMHDANMILEGGCVWIFHPISFVIVLFQLLVAPSNDARESLFIKYMGIMAGKIASANEEVSEASKNAVLLVFNAMCLSPDKSALCIDYFNKGVHSKISVFDTAIEFKQLFGEEAIRVLLFRALCAVSASEECITSAKLRILRELPRYLYISSDHFFQFCSEAQIDPNSSKDQKINANDNQRTGSYHQISELDSYKILGASKEMSDEELKNAYRAKAREYHPDVLRGKGVPKEMLLFAEEEMKKINSAWDIIKKARGIS